MPEKVYMTLADFAWLEAELLAKGFRRSTREEARRDFRRLEPIAPRPRSGREVGFIYYANGLTVTVWTSWLEAEGKMRDEDMGWVLIKEGNQKDYFHRPLLRTKNFCRNLLKAADYAKERVLLRPLCPECQQFMKIAKGKALRSHYWICRRLHADRRPVIKDWYYELPEKLRKKREYLSRERRRAKVKREKILGRPSTPAVIIRHPWRNVRPPP